MNSNKSRKGDIGTKDCDECIQGVSRHPLYYELTMTCVLFISVCAQ